MLGEDKPSTIPISCYELEPNTFITDRFVPNCCVNYIPKFVEFDEGGYEYKDGSFEGDDPHFWFDRGSSPNVYINEYTTEEEILMALGATTCKIVSPEYALEALLGEETFKRLKTIKEYWNSKIRNLPKLKLSEIKNEEKDKFYDYLYKYVFEEKYKLNLNDNDKAIVFHYLKNCDNSDEIIRLIYTFIFTSTQLVNNIEFCDYTDPTFVLVSLFKVVEIVFSRLLKERFGNKTIIDKYGKKIDLGSLDLTLGEMKQFFYSHDAEIIDFLTNDYDLTKDTKRLLGKWIDESRNGFLHKDLIEIKNLKQFNESMNDSMRLLCNLILLFKKYN